VAQRKGPAEQNQRKAKKIESHFFFGLFTEQDHNEWKKDRDAERRRKKPKRGTNMKKEKVGRGRRLQGREEKITRVERTLAQTRKGKENFLENRENVLQEVSALVRRGAVGTSRTALNEENGNYKRRLARWEKKEEKGKRKPPGHDFKTFEKRQEGEARRFAEATKRKMIKVKEKTWPL